MPSPRKNESGGWGGEGCSPVVLNLHGADDENAGDYGDDDNDDDDDDHDDDDDDDDYDRARAILMKMMTKQIKVVRVTLNIHNL